MRSILSTIKNLWRKAAFRVSASILILVVLIYNVPLMELWEVILRISPFLWIIVCAAFLCGHLIGVIKWSLFINTGEIKLAYIPAARSYFAGLFANLFLPSIAGGDVVRAGLAIRYKAKKENIIIGGILDRVLDISSLGLIIIISSICAQTSSSFEYKPVFLGFLIFISIFLLGIISILTLPRLRILPVSLTNRLLPFQDVIKKLLKDPKRATEVFFLSLLIQSGFILLNVLLGKACDIHLPIHVWFLTWPLAKLSAMIPISLGGIGVRETAFALLLQRYGIPLSKSVAVGLLWESVIIIGGLVGGLFYIYAKRTSPSSNFVLT